ncbi:UDP-N-acetylmuramoyl-L-alanyl-D-glutamate--2,6-diaminopimelate ligase [Patescibacteria group bacterium]|nr:UDP-N-acetylmuramoyl-L-alanyl-D-glutamate--2,6-diaminopimelate ligase [Patescibacteria group bacterium]
MKNLLRKVIPSFLMNWYHFILAFLGAVIYRFPARKLKIIGVTGTNGKSTVVHLISQILERSGYSVAAASSIEFKIKNMVWENDLKMTMPGRFKLQKFLHQAVQDNCEYVVLEVTSEGIKQNRHQFIGFDSAVLTNLTKEHLESHRGFDNYKKAKAKLFKSLKSEGKSIVNLDDSNAEYFLQFPAEEKWTYSIDNKQQIENNVNGLSFSSNQNGISFKVQNEQFNLNLLGKFNGYNALAAISVGITEGISLDKIKIALEEIKGIPGRLEIVIKEPYTVIVDYAHTPDALEKVYQAVKEIFQGLPNGETSKIIGVLGAAGGGRDKWKRPEFGKIAEQYLDQIIITNEDPYDEDPQEIIDQIAQGIENKQAEKIIDRRKAIHYALKSAQDGDVVIITGKGCEPWMCVANDKKIPWDDRLVVREEFQSFKERSIPKERP